MLPSKESSRKHTVCESAFVCGVDTSVRGGRSGESPPSISGEVTLQTTLSTFLPPEYFLERNVR